MTLTIQIVAALLLVVANGFFVATEFSVARIRVTQVAELEAEGRPGARSLRHAVDHLDAYLAACQVGITIASIGLGVVGKPAFETVIDPVAEPLGAATGIAAYGLSFGFAFGVVTLLHVVLGELAPKSLAIARTSRTALMIAPPMRLFYISTKPFVDLFNWMGNLILRPFGIPPAREVGHAPHSEDELRLLLRQSLAEGLIDPEEREFAENVFSFGERRARQIMVPRPQVVYLSAEKTLVEAAREATASGLSRLPLCEPEGGLDAIIGIVHVRDLLAAMVSSSEIGLRELARPVDRVSEQTLLDELLTRLRRNRRHLALVVDEHGTATGLVTLEDMLEEIVGEITDEFDPDEKAALVPQDGFVIVPGNTPVDVVADALELDIAEAHEATIGGHVVARLGRLTEVGERVTIDGSEAEVTRVGEGLVEELRFEMRAGATDTS